LQFLLYAVSEMSMPIHDGKGAVAPMITQRVPSQQRMRASVTSESALNVLMIDHTVEDRMAVRRALEAGGFVLQEAADAEHGLKLAVSSIPAPDCILLDHALPDTDGLEVVESLRQPGGTLPCAVVMLTKAGTTDVAAAATKLGVLDYLVKGRLDADVLGRAIRSAVRQFRTERRNAQLAAIVDASDDAIISLGTDLAVRTWNAGAKRLFGYSEAEACGRTLTELIVPGMHDAETAAVVYRAVMSGRAALLKETVRRRKDGQLVPVETNVSPILDGAGKVTGLSVVFRDMSERSRAEDPLRRLAMLFAVTSGLIRASGPGELGRMTFDCISSAFGADICANFRFDPVAKRLNRVFGHGLPSEHLSTQLGKTFCGTAALAGEAVVADKQRIGRDPKGATMRRLGATAYACYPLKASDGRLLGTFSVASRTREAFTDDEVASLGTITNFLAQAWERLEAEQDLRVSEERLRLSQEAAGLGHWDFDFASGTLVWSDQTRKMLGVEPGAPASWALLLSLVHAEDRRWFEEYLARSARPGSDQGCHHEFRIVMQSGGVRWLEDQSRMETNAAGMPVRAVGIIRDITERKNAEETQQVMVDELNHRVKNTLATVRALSTQTFRTAPSPEAFCEAFEGRLLALSHTHNLLNRSCWTGAGLRDILKQELAPYAGADGRSFTLDGDDLELGPVTAVTLGMAFHELATNAVKHGALSVAGGKVLVAWRMSRPGRLHVEWREMGGPPVSPPRRRGFGSRLIEQALASDLDGDARLYFPTEGVRCCMDIPLGHISIH
jgi:PAS domain S-box-containing protein